MSRSWLGTALLKMTNLWMPVTSLIMVRFSIHKKFWKALDLLYQMTVEMTGNNGGNDGNDGGNNRNDRNDGGNHLKMTNLWMPVTSLIMVRFSIRKKFWKALDLLYHMTVETTGKRWKRWGEMTETTGETTDRNDGGNHLKMTNLWMPVTSLIMVRGVIFQSWFWAQKVLESSWSPLPWR